jgi:hypothetical protein
VSQHPQHLVEPAAAPVDEVAKSQQSAVASWRDAAQVQRDRAAHRPLVLGFLAVRDLRRAARYDRWADETAAMTPAEYLRDLNDGY